MTYADLIRLSGLLANALKRLGVKPGDRVAAQVEKSVEALLIYLAALRAGAVYLPLNSTYTTGEESGPFSATPSRPYSSVDPKLQRT